MRVVVTEPVHPDALALLAGAGCAVAYLPALAATEADAALRSAEAILVRIRPVPAALMAPPLRLVVKHGTGVDNIPLAAAKAAGVAVMNTPGANAQAAAEHTLALILALAKALPAMQATVAAGRRTDPACRVIDLADARLLLVGYGAIARRVGALATAFGMAVTVHSPRLTGAQTAEGWAVAPDLRAALPGTDILSLHCPLTPATRRMIGAGELALLPPGALVVNTARGGIIDEAALAAARHLGGIALDATEVEPLPPDHPLQGRADVILTPHSAGASIGAFRAVGMAAARNILDFAAGRPDPAHLL